MRILHITKRYWPLAGGVERYVRDVAVEQRQRRHEVRVLTIDRDVLGVEPGRRLPPVETDDGVEVRRIPALGGQRKQVPIVAPRRLFAELRWSDVVHVHDVRFMLESSILIGRVTRRPVIVHSHGLILHTQAYASLKRWLVPGYFGPLLAVGPSAVVADSAADVRLLRERAHVPARRIRLLPNAVDLRRARSIAREPEPGRVLIFGRVDIHKGHADALRTLAGTTGTWHLDIAGSGRPELIDELRNLVRTLGIGDRITWHGQVPDDVLDELMGRAALALFPSRYEAFGLALLEAMAAGVPVLASGIEAHREVLGPTLVDRVTDFSAPAGGADVAVALRQAAAPTELVERLRARAADFGVERLADQLEGLYRQLGLAADAGGGG